MTFPLAALLAAAAAPAAVHVHAGGDESQRAASYLIEADKGLIAVDVPITVSEARMLRKTAEGSKKPLLAVLLTHARAGIGEPLAALAGGEQTPVPVVGSEAVLSAVDPQLPKRIVKDNQTISYGGASFTGHELGPSTVWVLLEKRPAAFVGDLVANGIHPRLDGGKTAAWIGQLERARKLLYGVPRIFPGSGQPTGGAILEEQRKYLAAYRAAVAELAKGRAQLDAAAKNELAVRMRAALPDGAFAAHIEAGADAVAAELATEAR